MKIALAQIDPTIGDLPGNTQKHLDAIAAAKAEGAALVVFPELSILGYPPRDLLAKGRLIEDVADAIDEVTRACKGIAALVGFVRRTPGGQGRPLQNAAALLADGEIKHTHIKTLLPTYDVFDETRYFEPGDRLGCFELAGQTIGVSICEDLWDAEALGVELYGDDPVGHLKGAGAEIIINMAGSPFQSGKAHLREELFARQAKRHDTPILYVNQVGGNDELVFDGSSCAFCADGTLLGRAKSFQEDILLIDLPNTGRCEPLDDRMKRLYDALTLGVRDYVHKCGFTSAVLGLSGGIDSALVAAIAADALGAENVVGLAMPSRYSSDHSLSDAEACARNLGIRYEVVPIAPMHDAFESQLGELLADGNVQIAEENIQARTRGVMVMAFSNAYGHLPLATGNKSELSVGYCTLYGDMCGGLAPIGDVLKMTVYALCEWLNRDGERIPRNIIDKAPSAELKPGQVDQDKLPPYEVLDDILQRYVEEDQPAAAIVEAGVDAKTVAQIVRMVDLSEYKRRQAAPTLKVTARAFGAGRRMPIAQRYRPGR
jgi:NAD+ synthase (glutamine-hydrolysing)